MVQLNTTYDSSIHQKIFVLKGDEAYARTTDTIATLITDFDNYATYIEKCHVGLEIQVLRELGLSKILIYIDDEVPWEIPWSDSGMAQIIDEDWNEQGVYWENGKLIIGKYVPNSINTGLFLLYDVEHTIKVEYIGNKCLGSSAKPIVFTVPSPDYFATKLTFNKENPRYAPDTTINDITVTLSSDHQMTSAKTVNIYDVTSSTPVLLDTVDLEQDVATPITLEGLSDGLHKIRASWVGDSESYATDSEIELSVGYKITNLEYPSYILQETAGTFSCTILDYFNNPWANLNVTVDDDSTWDPISDLGTTDNDGFVSISRVAYSDYPFYLVVNSWYSDEIGTVLVINPTSISLKLEKPITLNNESNTVTGTIMQNGSPIQVSGIDVTVSASYVQHTTTNTNGAFSCTYSDNDVHYTTVTASIPNTSVTASTEWHRVNVWWSVADNQYVGTPQTEGVTISKRANGFEFLHNRSGYRNVFFERDFGDNRAVEDFYKFKVTNKGLGTSKLYGYTFNELGIQTGDVVTVSFEKYGDWRIGQVHNTVRIYVNGTQKGSQSDYSKWGLDFDIAEHDPRANTNLVIDELIIERKS